MSASTSRRNNVLFVTGGGSHDFEVARFIFRRMFNISGRFTVTEVRLTEAGVGEFADLSPESIDVVLLCTQGGTLTHEQESGLICFVEAGGGLVGIHGASDSFRDNELYHKLLGSKFVTHCPGVFDFRVRFTDEARRSDHPIAMRKDDFLIRDEHYVVEPKADFDTFAVSHLRGQDVPMGYLRRQGKGTVIYLANGHHADALENRHFLHMVRRSLRVAAGEEFDPQPPTVNAGIIGYGGGKTRSGIARSHIAGIDKQIGMTTAVVGVLELAGKSSQQGGKPLPLPGEDQSESNYRFPL